MMLDVSFSTDRTVMFIDYSGGHLPYHIPSLWIAECYDESYAPIHRWWKLGPRTPTMLLTPEMLGERMRTHVPSGDVS